MDSNQRFDQWVKIQKVSAVALSPLLFIAGWFLGRMYFAPNIADDPNHGWRIPIIAGCVFAVIALSINLEKATPRTVRELKFIAVCAVLYSVLFASLFSVAIHDCNHYSSALHLLSVGMVLYVLQRCWRLGRDYEGGLEVQAMERRRDLAHGPVSVFEVIVVEAEVQRNMSVGRWFHASRSNLVSDSNRKSTSITRSGQANKLLR
jgi:hypothetical protein